MPEKDTNAREPKPVKRYREPDYSTESGIWHAGVRLPQFAVVLALALTRWVHLEEAMIRFASSLMGTWSNLDTARLMFRSIIAQNARISVMKSLLEHHPDNRYKSPEFDRIINEFSALNTLRNKYVHGLWFTKQPLSVKDGDLSNVSIVLQDSTVKGAMSEKVEVSVGEIEKFIERMDKLFEDIGGAEGEHFLSYVERRMKEAGGMTK